MSRPCDTCRHRVRWHGTHVCAQPLAVTGVPVERLRYHLSMVEPCESERRHGRLLAILTMTCGQHGRHWEAR